MCRKIRCDTLRWKFLKTKQTLTKIVQNIRPSWSSSTTPDLISSAHQLKSLCLTRHNFLLLSRSTGLWGQHCFCPYSLADVAVNLTRREGKKNLHVLCRSRTSRLKRSSTSEKRPCVLEYVLAVPAKSHALKKKRNSVPFPVFANLLYRLVEFWAGSVSLSSATYFLFLFFSKESDWLVSGVLLTFPPNNSERTKRVFGTKQSEHEDRMRVVAGAVVGVD